MNRDKVITAAVVFGGILVLAVARKLGADPDWISMGGAALAVVGGTLRSMLLGEAKS